MQNTQRNQSAPVVDPQELVSDQLLSQIRGDILLIRINNVTQICNRSAVTLRQQAFFWLNMAAEAKKASFIAGHISKKGGRFQIITRDQAIKLVAMWILKKLQPELM